MRILMTSLALSAAILAPTPVFAQSTEIAEPKSVLSQRADDVVAAMRGETAAETVFAPVFLAAVPPEQLSGLLTQLEAQFGALIGVESVTEHSAGSGLISLRFEKAIARGPLTLGPEPEQLVIGLLLNDFQPINDSIEAIQADIAALPGAVSVLYAPLNPGKEAVLSVDAERQMAIGSTFKLYILAALARQIGSGQRNWSDVVTLDRKSLPSGQMQNWPDGSPVTLHTLASLMISISDNTATDILLNEVGQDAVEAELINSGHTDPDRTLPFLSTLQMFGLKGSEANLTKYIAADEKTQRRILADFEDDIGGNPKLITPPRFSEPTAIDTVEWFASGQDLRKLMRVIVEFEDPKPREIMSINPALAKARRADWKYVGYKGGSEPGVLNLTWLLQDNAENWHVLAMSWNNTEAAVDQTALDQLSKRILSLAP